MKILLFLIEAMDGEQKFAEVSAKRWFFHALLLRVGEKS